MLNRLFKRSNTSEPRSTDQLGHEFKDGEVVEQRFEIEKVRRGFMGVVYIAYDRQQRRYVAIKTFQNKYLWDEEAITRFQAETELWMRLGVHPNIVRAYDTRIFLGKPHVIAEYVHGGTLRMLVPRIPLQDAVDYGIQVCRGMQYAVEQAAVMHCDLKPDNIMITVDGIAKVTDFGLAKMLPNWQWSERQRASAGPSGQIRMLNLPDTLGGTLPYMAPEMFDGSASLGVWTDIYAFGVMFYELTTGQLPFDSRRDESVIRMHLREPLPDPRRVKPNLHRGVVHIIERCMAKRPVARYQSFAEVEHDLQLLRKHLFGDRYPALNDNDSAMELERLVDRGLGQMKLGEYSLALRDFHRALDLDRSHPEIWALAARAHLKLWRYHEALTAIDEGLNRAEGRHQFGELYCVQGEVFATMRQPDKALAAYDQGLSYTPHTPVLWREKGALFLQLGRLREAQQCVERTLEYDPLDSQARQLFGTILYQQGKIKQAMHAYGESARLNPRDADAWVAYGGCLIELNRPKDALDAFGMALKIEPELDAAEQGIRRARQMIERR